MNKGVEYGEVIGHITCPGCGREDLELKVRQSGNIGYFCKSVVGQNEEGKPEYCYTRGNLGREASKKLINDYLSNGEKEHVEQSEIEEQIIEEPVEEKQPEPANDEREPERKSIASGIKHFFTADE